MNPGSKKFVSGLLVVLLLPGIGSGQQRHEQTLAEYRRPAVFSLTRVMVHDVVNPPAASRYYSYALLGAYDLVAQYNKAIVRPGLFVNGYPKTVLEAGADDYRI